MESTASDKITSGPIVRTIIALAVPVVLGMFMEVALSIINFFWVGRLGSAAQDAVTSSMVICWTAFHSISLATIGVTALVSRHIGAREPESAAHYVRQGLYVAICVGIITSSLGFFFAPELLEFMGAGEEPRLIALPYLRLFFMSTPLFALADTAMSAFRAAGNTRTPLIVGASCIVLNLALDPLFIFGLGPFPQMGVTGAALATLISSSLCTIVVIGQLLKGKAGFPIEWRWTTRPQLQSMLKIARIGVPISVQQLTFTGVYWFLIQIVHKFGEPAGAAMGIGNRMESLSYLTCYGFSLASSTMVGQNLGAKNPGRASRCAWGATGLAIAFTFITSSAFILVPNLISGIFTSDPDVHKIAADYLFILGLSQFSMAIEIVLEGSFSGAGDTLPPMLVMIPGAIVRIPLAYYLCFDAGFGINGVWWTMTITTTLKAAVLAVWFNRGGWKTKML